MTLVPFTALIWYQDVPETAAPVHVATQLPPVTLVTTVTLVSVPISVLAVALTEALVRRLAVQAAYLVTVGAAVGAAVGVGVA